MEQSLVESAIQMTKADNPAKKVLLKIAAQDILPQWVIKRQKDTFQGGSGVSDAVARILPNPKRFYSAELKRIFGYTPEE